MRTRQADRYPSPARHPEDRRRLTDLIVIPARWQSSRFPGKPLATIAGRTLLGRVVDLARRATCDLADVETVVATDDERIAVHARELGIAAVMTDPAIESGSGRALAAALTRPTRPRFIVNLQGDAPFVPAPAVRQVLDALAAGAPVATAVVQLSWPALDAFRRHKKIAPSSGTTCVRGANGDALWFSKAVLPAMRNEAALRRTAAVSPVFRHLGLYGYSLGALEQFEAASPSTYEQLEGLEQLRLLEAGVPIRAVLTEEQRIAISGIDTPEDARAAEALIAQVGDPCDR